MGWGIGYGQVMVKHSYRPLLAAVALMMALLGAISVAFFGSGQTPAGAYDLYVIEVNEQGFNPRYCQVNRGDAVTFKNVSSKPLGIVSGHKTAGGGVQPGGFGGMDPLFQVTIQPGQTHPGSVSLQGGSEFFFFSSFDNFETYEDYITVSTPGTQNTGQVSCSKEAPTPTPTPTGTPTPLPTPTPIVVIPANCTWNGCAIGIAIAADGE